MSKEIYYPLLENETIIRKLFGSKFLSNIRNDKLSIEECLIANKILGKYLYGKEIYQLLENKDIEKIEQITQEKKSKYEDIASKLSSMDLNNIGIVIIRPETIGITDKYIDFLSRQGLTLIEKKKILLNFEKYLIMYHDGLIHEEAKYDFPTRTLNYVNKDCYMLVVSSNDCLNIPTSDYLKLLKGKQGVSKKNTLRGDIAYNTLKQYVTNDGLCFSRINYNLPFDPIGMYRLITRKRVETDNSHDIADLKLLYYMGQAVHIPESTEIVNDGSVLFDYNDIDLIEQSINKVKRKEFM